MCNFVQLLGKVCWYHTATWRVSNETDIKAAKKKEALFVVFIIYNMSAYIINMRNDFKQLDYFWGGHWLHSDVKTFTIWLKWGPLGAVCDKCLKLQAGRQVSYKVKFVVKCPNRFPVPELDLKKTQSLGTGNWLEYFTTFTWFACKSAVCVFCTPSEKGFNPLSPKSDQH